MDERATPLCTECEVVGATPQSIALTVTGVSAPLASVVESAFAAYLASVELGGLVAVSAIYSALHVALALNGTPAPTLLLSLPAADVQLTPDRFPVKGSVTLL